MKIDFSVARATAESAAEASNIKDGRGRGGRGGGGVVIKENGGLNRILLSLN